MTSSTFTFRQATPNDADTILIGLTSLANDLGFEQELQATKNTILQHGFSNPPHFHTLLAEANDQLAGLAIYFPYYSTTRSLPGVYIQDLWVDKQHRRSGLGEQLLNQVGEIGQIAWQAGFLHLTVHAYNQAATRFYQRLGFQLQESDLVMSLELTADDNMLEGLAYAQ